MSEQDNLKIARAVYDSFNAHNIDKWRELSATGFRAEGPFAPAPLNEEQNRMSGQAYLNAFPDLHFTIDRTIAQGDYVVLDWTATGTQSGPLVAPGGPTLPATHKKATTHGSNTFEIKNGMITHSWVYFDQVSLLSQLGLMPPQ